MDDNVGLILKILAARSLCLPLLSPMDEKTC